MRGGAALAQHPRAVVAAEAEGLDGLLHPAFGVGGDTRFAVDHPGDRFQADTGPGGDIFHGGPIAVAGLGASVRPAVGG